MEVIQYIRNFSDAQYIIHWGSLAFLVFIVFAECSFLAGFFLPGNSLIFMAGILCYSNPETLGVNLFVLIVLLSIAAMVGYYIGYWFGFKTMGPRCLKPDTKIFIFKKWWICRNKVSFKDFLKNQRWSLINFNFQKMNQKILLKIWNLRCT